LGSSLKNLVAYFVTKTVNKSYQYNLRHEVAYCKAFCNKTFLLALKYNKIVIRYGNFLLVIISLTLAYYGQS